MNLFEAIEKRYSHKDPFKSDAVPLIDLEKIAKAGLTAPSGNNSQCVNMIILPERKDIAPLYEICQTTGLETAPAAIAVFTDSTMQNPPFNFEMEDYSAATQNMLLAATALGYGSLWLDYPWLSNDANHKAACAYMNAPENYRLRVVVLIGSTEGTGSRREKKPLETRLSYGKFGVKA
jgi:nitroreductase